MLDSQRTEKQEMLGLHKVAIAIVTLLLVYEYYFITAPPVLRVKNPKFSLLGPYNASQPSFPVEDIYNNLIDVKNFTFTVNPKPCDGYTEGLLLMVIVASNPNNYNNRMMIRNTWGRSTDSTKVVFLMGQTDNMTLINRIHNESLIYGDIVQGNFVDAYRNMTYKHVMGLKWVSHHCPTAKYVLKTDDDMVVNSHALRQFLVRELSPWGAKGLITCQVLEKAVVQRSNRSKWRVTPAEFAERYYPTYCAGWAILYSQDVVPKLLKSAQVAPYFWIDDVHITGVIAEQIGVPRTPLSTLVLSKHRANILTSLGSKYAEPFLFGPPDLSVDRISQIWKAIPA